MHYSLLKIEKRNDIINNKLKSKESIKTRFDIHTRPTSFAPGVRVCLRNHQTGRWDTPAEIVPEVAPRSCSVTTDDGSRIRRASRRIKPIPTSPHGPIMEKQCDSPSGEEQVTQKESTSSQIRKSDCGTVLPRRLIEEQLL